MGAFTTILMKTTNVAIWVLNPNKQKWTQYSDKRQELQKNIFVLFHKKEGKVIGRILIRLKFKQAS
jgi:hypothetical protein